MTATILWVDDQISDLAAYVGALKKDGFSVETTDRAEAAVELARQRSFDIYLIDIRMPGTNGIECARQIHALRKDSKIALVSSFLYLPRHKAEIRALGYQVDLMDKNFPVTTAPEFEECFLAPIRRLVTQGVTQTISQYDVIMDEMKGQNPFHIPLAEFQGLPLAVKDRLREEAFHWAKKAVNKAFEEGKIWVMLCGDEHAIRSSANSLEEVPDEDKLLDYSRLQNRPAYYFWNQTEADDIWVSCGGNAHNNYPTVTLEFDGHTICGHFDTGSPFTFFSYEELLEKGLIRAIEGFGPARRVGYATVYMATKLDLKAHLRCQVSDQTKEVVLRGQIVKKWENSPFVRKCDEKCVAVDPKRSVGSICGDRVALVGRNILTENGLRLVLDGVNRKTCFK